MAYRGRLRDHPSNANTQPVRRLTIEATLNL
jgi:hypothetical protein